MNLSSYIKALRDKKGLTQEQAAKELGVTTQTIMNWENNRSTPDMHNVKNISRVYGVDMLELLKKMAEEVDGVKQEQDKEVVDTCPWIDLLPNNFDYEGLESFRLSEQEAKMLIDIHLSFLLKCDLSSIISQDFPDRAEAIEAWWRLKQLNLCNSRDRYKFEPKWELTYLGEYCYGLVKNNKLFLRDIYKLPFNEFVKICDELKLFDMESKTNSSYSFNLLNVLKLFNEGDVFIDVYEKKGYRDEFIKNAKHPHVLDIAEEFCVIEETEWDNVDYLADREAYLKKLKFYEENKDSISDLREPSPVPQKTFRKAVPTQKTINFLAKLNEE